MVRWTWGPDEGLEKGFDLPMLLPDVDWEGRPGLCPPSL